MLFPVYLCLLVFTAFTNGNVPDGYILEITPTCGSDGVEDGRIDVTTDLAGARVMAVCDDNMVYFTAPDRVHFTLPVSYPGGPQPCRFSKKTNDLVYSVRLIISFGETGKVLHEIEEEKTVTCTFSPKATNHSEAQDVLDSYMAPTEVQNNAGPPSSTASVILQFSNIAGEDLSNIDVAIGRTVMLTAVASNTAPSEVGLRPTSCDAVASGTRYAVLRAGCGDGIVFSKTDGFTTDGMKATSPYFSTLKLEGNSLVNFECNFTLCSENCDGSSCQSTSGRRRRRSPRDLLTEDTVNIVAQSSMTLETVERTPLRHRRWNNVITSVWSQELAMHN